MESQKPLSASSRKSNRETLFVIACICLLCCCGSISVLIVFPPILSVIGQVNGSNPYTGIADREIKKNAMEFIQNYESTALGCNDVQLLAGEVSILPDQSSDGSWSEIWKVDACGEEHLYGVKFTPFSSGETGIDIFRPK